jgi:hypothetical protein
MPQRFSNGRQRPVVTIQKYVPQRRRHSDTTVVGRTPPDTQQHLAHPARNGIPNKLSCTKCARFEWIPLVCFQVLQPRCLRHFDKGSPAIARDTVRGFNGPKQRIVDRERYGMAISSLRQYGRCALTPVSNGKGLYVPFWLSIQQRMFDTLSNLYSGKRSLEFIRGNQNAHGSMVQNPQNKLTIILLKHIHQFGDKLDKAF